MKVSKVLFDEMCAALLVRVIDDLLAGKTPNLTPSEKDDLTLTRVRIVDEFTDVGIE